MLRFNFDDLMMCLDLLLRTLCVFFSLPFGFDFCLALVARGRASLGKGWCKLAVLPGVWLHKLVLHYSRAAEPSYLGKRFPGLSVHAVPAATLRAVRTLSAGPVRSKGVSPWGGRGLVPAASGVAAVTVISAEPPCPRLLALFSFSILSSWHR